MRLSVVGDVSTDPLAAQWVDVLRPMVIRHPDQRITVEVTLTTGHPPRLQFRLDVGYDTTDPQKEFRPLHISEVNLGYFPGATLAQAWVAAAWTSYLMHEALELVTANGARPIDPHGPLEATNKCMRDGLPHTLTAATLRQALAIVMTDEAAAAMMGAV